MGFLVKGFAVFGAGIAILFVAGIYSYNRAQSERYERRKRDLALLQDVSRRAGEGRATRSELAAAALLAKRRGLPEAARALAEQAQAAAPAS